MAQRRRSPRAVGVVLILAILDAGCAHTRGIFYPPPPKRLAKRVPGPRVEAKAPEVGTRPAAESPKAKTVVRVD